MNKFINFWKSVVWIIIMGVVFLLPANNLSSAPSIPFLSESVHIFIFAVLAWFLVRDQQKSIPSQKPLKKIYFLAFILSFCFGILIEILQEMTGLGRKAEIKDVLFDLCGILVSIGILLILSFIKEKSGIKD